MKIFHKKGFTVVEILVAVSILALILSVVMPSFSKFRDTQALKTTAEDVFSAIDKARGNTLASVNSSEYGVHFQSDKVVIFKGTVYLPSDSSNQSISIFSPATISNVTLGGVSGSTGEIFFNRLSGAPSKTGINTITISVNSNSKVITISPTGTMSMN